jgi:peptidoglycan/LPS O-acetylase OafA/YrhL
MNEPAAVGENSGNIPALDGIRGILALWVLLGHTLIGVGGSIPVLNTLGLAVYGFMTLSGFLMAAHYRLREPSEPWRSVKTWRLFYTRRFFRLAPLYYFALAIAFTFHHWYILGYQEIAAAFPNGFTPSSGVPGFELSSILVHATFLFGLIPSQANNNILPDWSLGLEMQFYFVFPFLMLALRKIGPAWFAFATWLIMTTAQKYCPTYPQPSFVPLVLSAFVVGMMVSEAWLTRDKLQASAFLVLAMFLSSVRMPATYQFMPLILTFLVIFPKLFPTFKIHRVGNAALKILGSRFGSYIGDRSYSVYLLHMLVLVPVFITLMKFPEFDQARPLVRFSIASPMVLVLCFAASELTFRFIEKPFIAVGRRLISSTRVVIPSGVEVKQPEPAALSLETK